MRKRIRAATSLLIAAAATVAATSAVAGVVSGPSTELGTPIAPVYGPPVVQSVGEAQQSLDVLKQPSTAATALPASLRSRLSESTLAGENPDLGRKALTTGDRTYWVVPAAAGKVCLFVNSGGGGCAPASQIDTGKFSGVMPCAAGGPAYYGMLPNNVAGITLTLDDGTKRQITTTNNVWAIQIARDQPQPTSLSWTGNDDDVKQAPIASLPGGVC
jgi:hypothetical protein